MDVNPGLLLVAMAATIIGLVALMVAGRGFSTSTRLQRETLDAVLTMTRTPPSGQVPPTGAHPSPLNSQYALDGRAPLPPVDSQTIPDLMLRYATEVASLMDLTAWIATWLSDDQLKLLQLIMETPGLRADFLPDSETTNLGFLRYAGLVVTGEDGHVLVPAPFHEPIRRVARARQSREPVDKLAG